jgi:hypothetical protein
LLHDKNFPSGETGEDSPLHSFVFWIVLDVDRRPILIAQIEEGGWADKPNFRLMADYQFGLLHDMMVHDSPLPHHWCLSLLTTSPRVYCGDATTYSVKPDPTETVFFRTNF